MSARPSLRADLIVRAVEDDFVVYDPVSDRTALLNVSAAAVLEFCDGRRSTEEVAVEVARFFSQDLEQVEKDVRATVKQFSSQGWFDPE